MCWWTTRAAPAAWSGNSDENNRDHGLDPATGTLACGSNVASSPVTLTYGGEPINDGDVLTSSNLTVDFGFYKLELGNYVWLDSNNDGKADAGEPSLPNMPVRLLNSGGAVLSNTVTNASGFYTFTGLVPGTYCAEITPTPPYTSSTGPNQSPTPDNNTDSDDNGTTITGDVIRSNCMLLTAGGEPIVITNTGTTKNPTLDFGVWAPAGVGNYVWIDQNQNGLQNTGEMPVSNSRGHALQQRPASHLHHQNQPERLLHLHRLVGGQLLRVLCPAHQPLHLYVVDERHNRHGQRP